MTPTIASEFKINHSHMQKVESNLRKSQKIDNSYFKKS